MAFSTPLKFLAGQLGNPNGWFGRTVMARLLDRGNRALIDATLARLELQPSDRFLDVGFGGGYSLGRALECGAHVHGVEPSDDMVQRAREVYASAAASGRLSLCREAAESLPFSDASFDKIFTVNTIYFWTDPDRALESLHRVLVPEGRLAIGFSSASKMKRFSPLVVRHGFRLWEPEDIENRMTQAGFVGVRSIATTSGFWSGDYVSVGCKAARG